MAALTPQQGQQCDHVLIGITSVRMPEEQWKDMVDLAVRVVTKPQNREYHGTVGSRNAGWVWPPPSLLASAAIQPGRRRR